MATFLRFPSPYDLRKFQNFNCKYNFGNVQLPTRSPTLLVFSWQNLLPNCISILTHMKVVCQVFFGCISKAVTPSRLALQLFLSFFFFEGPQIDAGRVGEVSESPFSMLEKFSLSSRYILFESLWL